MVVVTNIGPCACCNGSPCSTCLEAATGIGVSVTGSPSGHIPAPNACGPCDILQYSWDGSWALSGVPIGASLSATIALGTLGDYAHPGIPTWKRDCTADPGGVVTEDFIYGIIASCTCVDGVLSFDPVGFGLQSFVNGVGSGHSSFNNALGCDVNTGYGCAHPCCTSEDTEGLTYGDGSGTSWCAGDFAFFGITVCVHLLP